MAEPRGAATDPVYVAPPVGAVNGHPPPVRLLRMDREDPECWALLPQLAARVLAWGTRFDQTGAPLLVQRLEACFVLHDDAMAAWVGVRGQEIVAHLIAAEDLHGARRVGFVAQLVMAPRVVPDAVKRAAERALEGWARARGFQELMMLTSRFRPTGWQRRFGFTPYRLLCRKEIG
jgi:hypothetical protein